MSSGNQLTHLKKENEALKDEVELWKQKLVQVGLSRGVSQFSTPMSTSAKIPKVAEKVSSPVKNTESSTKKDSKVAKEEKKKKETSNDSFI